MPPLITFLRRDIFVAFLIAIQIMAQPPGLPVEKTLKIQTKKDGTSRASFFF